MEVPHNADTSQVGGEETCCPLKPEYQSAGGEGGVGVLGGAKPWTPALQAGSFNHYTATPSSKISKDDALTL